MKKYLTIIAVSAVLASLFASPQVEAAPAFVQATSTAGSVIATSTNVATFGFASSVTAGNMIAVYVRWQANANTSTITSVTDTQGDTFLPAFSTIYDASSSPQTAVQIWYALNTIGGANTSTVNFSTSTNANGVRMGVLEYSGIATTSALDIATTSITVSASTTFYSGSITTRFPNELLLGGFSSAGSSHTCVAGTGYTQRIPNVAVLPYCVEDKIVSATGTYQATGTYSAAADFAAFIIGFSASSTASTSATNAMFFGGD